MAMKPTMPPKGMPPKKPAKEESPLKTTHKEFDMPKDMDGSTSWAKGKK